jgi:heavy metal sensor kinase
MIGAKRLRRWGSVRLRLTLWNVAVLALILGALGGVVRYTALADLYAKVDQILAQRVPPPIPHLQFTSGSLSLAPGPPPKAERVAPAIMHLQLTSAPDAQRVRRRRGPAFTVPPGATTATPPPPLRRGPGLSGRSAGHRQPGIGVSSSGGRRPAPGRPAGGLVRMIYRNPPKGLNQEPLDRRSLARSFAGQEVYSTVRANGAPVRVLSVPVERRGRVERVLQLAYPLAGVFQELDGLTRTLLELVPLGLLAAGLGGAFLTGRVLRPVGEIAAAAARLGAHNLSGRLPVSGQDEFTALATSFNALLARLEEAFDRQRRFTADASHELRTPLSIIKVNTNVALEHPWPADRYRELLTAIDAAASRQGRLVEELLFLARADAGGRARDVGQVCLLEVLEEAAEAVEGPHQPCVRLEVADPALMVPGSGSELTRLFTNLLQNAVRHTPPQGAVTVAIATDAQSVIVTVSDTGEGIAPEHLPFLGERFYRVDAARASEAGSTGLGLAICRSIVQAHGGQMTIESTVGRGTTVRVALPLQAGRPSAGAASPSG